MTNEEGVNILEATGSANFWKAIGSEFNAAKTALENFASKGTVPPALLEVARNAHKTRQETQESKPARYLGLKPVFNVVGVNQHLLTDEPTSIMSPILRAAIKGGQPIVEIFIYDDKEKRHPAGSWNGMSAILFMNDNGEVVEAIVSSRLLSGTEPIAADVDTVTVTVTADIDEEDIAAKTGAGNPGEGAASTPTEEVAAEAKDIDTQIKEAVSVAELSMIYLRFMSTQSGHSPEVGRVFNIIKDSIKEMVYGYVRAIGLLEDPSEKEKFADNCKRDIRSLGPTSLFYPVDIDSFITRIDRALTALEAK